MKKETLEKAKQLEGEIEDLKHTLYTLKNVSGFKCRVERVHLLSFNSCNEYRFYLSDKNKNSFIAIIEKELEEKQAELEDL